MVLGDRVGVHVNMDRLSTFAVDVAQFGEHLGQHIGAYDQVHIAALSDGQAVRAEHMTRSPPPQRVTVRHIQIAAVHAPYVGTQSLGYAGQGRFSTRT